MSLSDNKLLSTTYRVKHFQTLSLSNTLSLSQPITTALRCSYHYSDGLGKTGVVALCLLKMLNIENIFINLTIM